MLSRVAENLYWAARYLERSENTARMINVFRDGEHLTGWFGRGDIQATPKLRLFAGAANAPDLARDPYYVFLDKYFLVLQVPVALLLYAIGGWSFVIYGVFVRAVALWHCTWLINSANHMFGYRHFDSDDNSRNLWWVALLTYGEGWHNNHHAFPKMAKAGLTKWEIDPTWWLIKGLKQAGLATKVVMPPAKARLS